MLLVAIYVDDVYGLIKYNSKDTELMVNHPDNEVRHLVREYLTNPHPFSIQLQSEDQLSSSVDVEIVPTESIDLIKVSLCEMFVNIGVHVDWDNEANIIPQPQNDMQSVDGKENYRVIN